MSPTRRWALAVLAVVIVMAAVVGGALVLSRGGGPGGSATGRATPSGTSGSSPSTITGPRVWLIILENHSYGDVIGSNAPFLTDLAARYGLATDYHAVARPSQPNYIALVSGSTQGVSDDDVHDLNAPTLFDQLDAAGRSWRVFAENVPSGCFTGEGASGGPDGSGNYARKHEPAISFVAISRDPARCARISSLTAFDPAAANFSLIIPNLCHDMHDCSVRTGDRWLKDFVPRIIDSGAFREGDLLIVTFDEASSRDKSQHVALIFAGPRVSPGTHANGRADHYDLLRTMQSIFGLACLEQSCSAAAISELSAGP